MGRRNWTGLLLALFATSAFAQGPGAVRKQVEASMLVTGHVLIEPDGSVSGWEIDQRDKLPPAVVGLIEKAADVWRFEPVVVDGRQRKAKARMSLRMVAKKLEDDEYRVSIVSGHFGDEAITPEERQQREDSIRSLELKPPSYPVFALEVGARGTVYVVLRIARDGSVADAHAEQVNLRFVGSEQQMKQMRNVLSKSALRAAKDWRFRPPVSGDDVDDEFWYVRVPVDYQFTGQRTPGYGEWDAYVPGPRQVAPWSGLENLDGFDIPPDALIAGEVYQVGKGRKLLTPLGEGG